MRLIAISITTLLHEGSGDFLRVDFAKAASTDEDGLARSSKHQLFNFQNQFVSFAHTYRCGTLVSQKMGMVGQEPLNNFFNRCVLRQKEHEIMRKFQRLLHNLVEIRINMLQTVLCQKLIASTSPRWTQKHAVKFLASVARNFELRNR
jgi:hypothetical protein